MFLVTKDGSHDIGPHGRDLPVVLDRLAKQGQTPAGWTKSAGVWRYSEPNESRLRRLLNGVEKLLTGGN
jgi:hypothetical protein